MRYQINLEEVSCLQYGSRNEKAGHRGVQAQLRMWPRFFHPSAYVCEWLWRCREYWFWGYKSILVSRWIHTESTNNEDLFSLYFCVCMYTCIHTCMYYVCAYAHEKIHVIFHCRTSHNQIDVCLHQGFSISESCLTNESWNQRVQSKVALRQRFSGYM